jgi:hypothetical protein
MSETTTQEHTGRRHKPAAETADHAAAGGGNGQDTTALASGTVDVPMAEIDLKQAGFKISVPYKFSAGHILTDHEAKVLDAAYQRQFRNNEDANAKARAERLAKAIAENDAAGIEENQPWTAERIAARYATYQPAVGDTVRLSTLERMRYQAAEMVWNDITARHNKAVIAGAAPVIAALVTADGKAAPYNAAHFNLRSVPTVKNKSETAEAFEARKQAIVDARNNHWRMMLDRPKYAEAIQAAMDALMQAKEDSKAESKAEEAAVVVVPQGALLD